MSVRIRFRFDGSVLVPVELPVPLPINQELTADIEIPEPEKARDHWRLALDRIVARGVHGVVLKSADLSRDQMYPDRT